ncbi:leukocyte elastase inhibitor-like [Clavelina lepadiformis]|uniref:leukocyte elastase inhibitor-like n=1 Tax=Clavelina lepadiformis TaxID=159417 RepID=UPI004040FC9D
MVLKVFLLLVLIGSVLSNSWEGVKVELINEKYESCRVNEIAAANRAFALDLFHQIAETDGPDENILISPLVISMGLSMILMGTNGNTAEELRQVLRYNETLDNYVPFYCIYERYENLGPVITLRTASKLFGAKTENFLDTFLGKTAFFGAKIERVDFENDGENTRQAINEWVAVQTSNHISELFQPDSISPLTRLILVSAIYFEAFWKTPFETKFTSPFVVSDDVQIPDQPFMDQRFDIKVYYDEDTDLYFLDLPYKSGARDPEVSMMLVYDDNKQPYVETGKRLTSETLSRVMERLPAERLTDAIVSLPIFEMNVEKDMVSYLQSMGIESLFMNGQADLSGMNGMRNLFIEGAKHKTFIRVDQNGTVAAGVFEASAIFLSLPFYAVFNHPFHFMLWEKQTNNILFMGRLVNPSLP